jgi:hypothetical protein
MLSDSDKDQELPERISYEIDCFVSEELTSNQIEDYSNEYNDPYWLEMFRHAVKESNQHVQRRLQQKFSSTLLNWIHDHPKCVLACRLQTEEYYIIETFSCFWLTLRKQQKFDFANISDVLSYLHVSMNGVILDTFRNYSTAQEAPLTSSSMERESQPDEIDNSHEIWGLIEGKLSSMRERRMAYLLFQCALKPRDIVESFPDEFNDVNEISHIRRNIMELLSSGDQIYFAMNKIS